jgi:hypothetical protein
MGPVIETFGFLLLAVVTLMFCWWLLFGLNREKDAEQTAAVNELLLTELAADRGTILPLADGASVGAAPSAGSIGHDPE